MVLYTTPVWAKALAIKKNKNILKKVQRTALIRTSTAYRTVSHAALCTYGHNADKLKSRAACGKLRDTKDGTPGQLWYLLENSRHDECVWWRTEWLYYREDNWTRRIVDSCIFKNNKRNIDHYTMQMLSRHGVFNEYWETIRKETHARCWDCDVESLDSYRFKSHRFEYYTIVT